MDPGEGPWAILGRPWAVLAKLNKADALERLEPLAGRLSAMWAEGLSVRQMVERLNDEGVASPHQGAAWPRP